jgi:hypothetical protein
MPHGPERPEGGRLMLCVPSTIRPVARTRDCEVPHAGTWLESQPESGRHRLIGYGLAFCSPVQGLPKSCRGKET